MDHYQKLHSHFKKLSDLGHVKAITGWDEAVMMPTGGGDTRGQALSTLSVIIHEMTTSSAVGDLINNAESESLDKWQAANLREIKRTYQNATCIPADLVEQQQRACSKSEQAWRSYREANDWTAMLPYLKEVITLARREAEIRSDVSGLNGYDALLDIYEPGARSSRLDEVFGDLKSFLPGFVDEVIEKQKSESILPLKGGFSIEKQRSLGHSIMKSLGFDFEHGRLDVSHHPFCGGVPDDVRITTRYQPDSFVSSLMAVIHETGHAMYEQGLPAAWRDQPVGEALSSATHESQSLLMEMQACRTRQFLQHMTPIAQMTFLGSHTNDPAWSVDNLYRLYTRVEKSYIRVDADEATYPLHVILRYELERDLIEGKLEVDDLPDAWNDKMQNYLSLSTSGNYADGCLQDVHWACGLIGYFPTYTLGAMTAAQLFNAAGSQVDNLLDDVGSGNFAPLVGWLRENVHSKGSFLSFDELMVAATGQPVDAKYLKSHLEARYLNT